MIEIGLALLGAGALAGLMAGLLGVGGGLVVVPVLYTLYDGMGVDPAIRMHVAVATSLLTICATAIASARAHHRAGAIDVALLRGWGPGILIGAVAGVLSAVRISGGALTLFFIFFALGVALWMSLGRKPKPIRPAPPMGLAALPVSVPIGLISVMMGIGGGTLSVPAQALCGVPTHRAVGTASAFGFLIALPGAIAFGLSQPAVPVALPYMWGHLHLAAAAAMAPTTMLLAPVGARLAHRLPERQLRRVFALFLLVTAARMGWNLLKDG